MPQSKATNKTNPEDDGLLCSIFVQVCGMTMSMANIPMMIQSNVRTNPIVSKHLKGDGIGSMSSNKRIKQ